MGPSGVSCPVSLDNLPVYLGNLSVCLNNLSVYLDNLSVYLDNLSVYLDNLPVSLSNENIENGVVGTGTFSQEDGQEGNVGMRFLVDQQSVVKGDCRVW